MGHIGLSSGFSLIPEGTHVFKIIGVTHKEDYGKIEVKMQTQDGLTHVERFGLKKQSGEMNEGALNAFSYFARVALNDFSAQDIDTDDLIGCFMECDVEHDVQDSKKDPSKTVTFAKLADKRPSDGWVEEPKPAPKAAPIKPATAPLDLDALLG